MNSGKRLAYGDLGKESLLTPPVTSPSPETISVEYKTRSDMARKERMREIPDLIRCMLN